MDITIHLSAELEALVKEVLMAKRRQPKPKEAPAALEVPSDLKEMRLYALDSKLCKAWPEVFPEWKQAFPGLDVLAEIRKAHSWEMAHPENRKVLRLKFLHSWLQRSNDRGRPLDPISVLATDMGRGPSSAGGVSQGRDGVLSDAPW